MILTRAIVITILFTFFLTNALGYGMVTKHVTLSQPMRNHDWNRMYYKRFYPKRKLRKRVRNRIRAYRGPDLDWPEIPPVAMVKLPLDVPPE